MAREEEEEKEEEKRGLFVPKVVGNFKSFCAPVRLVAVSWSAEKLKIPAPTVGSVSKN